MMPEPLSSASARSSSCVATCEAKWPNPVMPTPIMNVMKILLPQSVVNRK